jgi:SAM-dependent methyltransferase
MDFASIQRFAKLVPMTSKDIAASPRTKPLEKCPVCEGADTTLFFSAPDRLHGVPGEFSYHKCGQCDSVFQNPMVIREDLHLCYPGEYEPYSFTQESLDLDFGSLPDTTLKQRMRRAIVRSVRGETPEGVLGTIGGFLSALKFIRERAFYGLMIDACLPKGTGPHKAFDLGCGTGWLMRRLRLVGWDVDGLEWNAKAAELARQATDGEVWSGDFFDADLPAGKYDLVVLNHVFEHFADPAAVLSRIRNLLTENGKVVLFYPNPNAMGTKRFGSKWFPWEVPRHLVLPSVKAMDLLAKRTNFKTSNTHSRAYYSEVHWARSKAYVLDRDPETDAPELDRAEKFGVNTERVQSMLGFDVGWEVVSVLEK